MKITFWGIRGSHPAIIENSAYGNHTSCVEVTAGKQRLIFDAGTGINSLGKSLMKSSENEEHHLSHLPRGLPPQNATAFRGEVNWRFLFFCFYWFFQGFWGKIEV